MASIEEWRTASQTIGTCHTDKRLSRATQAHRVAGLSSADAAYASAANDYPRFERQMIRTIFDKDIIAGTKQPLPELLRNYPSRAPLVASRPATGSSMRSAASRRTVASAAGSVIASVASSVPPPGYFRQVPTPNSMYKTSGSRIGGGGYVAPEPVQGREAWLLGRGGGQQSSFDNCLVLKSLPWAA